MSEEKPTYEKQEPLIPFQMQVYNEEGRNRFAYLINQIAEHSPTARPVLEAAVAEGFKLQLMAMGGSSGFVCEDYKTIYLNSLSSDNVLIETLAHECRHVQQHANGVPYKREQFVLRDALKISRAQEADAETIGASACYEIMQRTGNDGPWKELEEKAPKITAGMMAAATAGQKNVDAKMMQGAFDGWYQNKRIMDIYDNSYLLNSCLSNSLDTRYNKPEDYFKREMSSAEIVNMFCKDASGKSYWADKPDVLDEPHRMQVEQKIINFANIVDNFRKENGYKRDESVKDIYVYGQLPKAAEQTKQPAEQNKQAAMQKAVMARRIAGR